MASYETDEEQIEALKRWWKDNGTSLLTGIVIVLAVYFGVGQFQSMRAGNAGVASDLYQQIADIALVNLTQGITETDLATAQSVYNDLKNSHGDSIYTRYAALVMARFHVEQDQLDLAATELQWILDNRKLGFLREADEELFTVASLRLARIKLAQGEAQAALEVLTTEPVSDEFMAGYAEIEGDIHMALNNPDAARSAYEKALAALTTLGSGSPVPLQLKLLELGVTPAEAL